MSFPIQFEPLLRPLQTSSFCGAEVLFFSPEDLLFVLCGHGAKHRWGRLEWICDISELIRGYQTQIDWNEVIESAERFGIRRMVFLGLHLAAELLESPVPEEVLQAIRTDVTVTRLGADVRRRLSSPPTAAGIFANSFFYIRARERRADRMRYLVRLLLRPTPGDWSLIQLPAHLHFLYYLLRPFRLFARHGVPSLKQALSLASAIRFFQK